MSFLKTQDAKAVRERFTEELKEPVVVDLFVRPKSKLVLPGHEDCLYCEEAKELLQEVADLSDLITLKVHDIDQDAALAKELGIAEVPAMVMTGSARGKVRFLGIPLGYEFATLLGDLIDVSSGSTALAKPTLAALADLDKDVTIKVFVTPTCPYCPGPARMAHQMAVESDRVIAEVIEVSEFPEMGEKYEVQGVPKIVFNDAVELVGAQLEGVFIQAVLEAAGAGKPPASR